MRTIEDKHRNNEVMLQSISQAPKLMQSVDEGIQTAGRVGVSCTEVSSSLIPIGPEEYSVYLERVKQRF